MGVVASRPFVSTKDRYSSFDIENLNNYAVCAAMWVNNNEEMGVYNVGCTSIQVDLPVPVPVPIEDKKDTPVEKEDTTSGAASLAYSALAAAALFALTN